MSEDIGKRMTRIEILKKRPWEDGEPLALSIGQAVYLWKSGKEKSLTVACPKCGQECSLADHEIEWHDEVTVTVTPSIIHDEIVSDPGFFRIEELLSGKVKKEVEEQKKRPKKKCGAHFYIKKNEIVYA